MRKSNGNNRSFNIISNKKLAISTKQNNLKHTVVGSPSIKLELNKNSILDLKRTGTNNYILDSSEIHQSKKSIKVINLKNNHRRKSLKFIEKNIKNRLHDISIQIEKEENISCINPKENNLNISAFIKNKIDGESDVSSPKNRLSVNINWTKKKNSEVKNFKFENSYNISKNNLLPKNDGHHNSIQKMINNF